MIGFPGTLTKMEEITIDKVDTRMADLLIEGETLIAAFRNSYEGDVVVFTGTRVIVCTPQGVTGKKLEFTLLPYSRVQGFSVEAAGALDSDAEMVLSFLGLGQLKVKFSGHADVAMLARTIGGCVR